MAVPDTSALHLQEDDRWLSFQRCLWISPIALTAHAVEDVPRLAQWMRETQLFEPVNRQQLAVALAFLIGLSCLSSYAAGKRRRWGVYAFLWMQGFILLHGISHVVPSLWLLTYTLGTATGVLLIPYSAYVIRDIRKERNISRKALTVIVILCIFLYDPVLRLSFTFGDLVEPQPRVSEPTSQPSRRI